MIFNRVKTDLGQTLIILIMVMTIGLAIGLSVIQKSLTDVSTSTKVEQSSRAFSAAEAGIERALRTNSNSTFQIPSTELLNDSKAQVTGGTLEPTVPTDNSRQKAIEYLSLAKEDIAHVWLADPFSSSNPPAFHFDKDAIIIYWGTQGADKAAVALTIIYYKECTPACPVVFKTIRKFYDSDSSRTAQNGFETATCSDAPNPPIQANTIFGDLRPFYCSKDVTGLLNPPGDIDPGTPRLMLLRARLLYNSTSQPFAVQPASGLPSCGSGVPCAFPPQAKIYASIGISGETQRAVQLFQMSKVVPFYFDYALYSSDSIDKN